MRLCVASMYVLAMAAIACAAPATAPAGECRALILCGDAGAEPNGARRFEDWTRRWAALLKDTCAFKADHVRVLRSPTGPASKPAGIPPAELATYDNIMAALADLVKQSHDEDQVVLILIGQGYDSQGLSKLCLVGKDISDVDVARALDKLRAKQFVCINTAAASAPWAKSLSRKDRVIITATATVEMRSQTYFCEFLLRALSGGNITLLDAFNRGSMNTLRWYQNQFVEKGVTTVHGKEFQQIYKAMYPDREMQVGENEPKEANNNAADMSAWLGRRVLSETAGLEDNGDGEPSTIYEAGSRPAPLPSKAGDGLLAGRVILGKP